MSRAEDEGFEDFYRGKDLHDCPYPSESREAEQWRNGNEDAFDEYRQRHADWYGKENR